jgi:hypothetical protein
MSIVASLLHSSVLLLFSPFLFDSSIIGFGSKNTDSIAPVTLAF